MNNQKTAIVIGATGLTGRLLVSKLIGDDSYKTIKLFSRRSSEIASPKIEEYVGDVLHLEQFKKDFFADEVFVCVGTTSARTKDRRVYHAIDFGIPVSAARMAKENSIPVFMVISALGSNPGSRIFYNRTKGEMEQAVLEQEISSTYILRPSLILGQREEGRFGESLGAVFLKVLQVFLQGNLKKYRAIKAESIAAAMIELAGSLPDKQIIDSDLIQKLGEK